MSQAVRLGIIGAGASGRAHATGAQAAGGYKLIGAADLIPDRLKAMGEPPLKIATLVEQAERLATDPTMDAVCICLPTHLHAPVALAALKTKKHVLIELPPGPNSKDAKAIAKAAEKAGRVVLYSSVRRFGAAEQSARQAIEKGYAGKLYHARATFLRTRGVPRGTGWYQDATKSGGGAIVDLATPLVDLLIHFFHPAKPRHGYAVAHATLTKLPVEESASILLRFDDGSSAEIACAWAMNQPPSQAGATLRLFGDAGAIDVYTPRGPILHRGFDDRGQSKASPMKQPKLAGHAAMMRHFRDCIINGAQPLVGPQEGVELMQTIEAIYKSVTTGKAVEF